MHQIDLLRAPPDSDVVAAVRAGSRMRRRGMPPRREQPVRRIDRLRRRSPSRTYVSLADFYEHPLRAASQERDVGLRWVAGDGRTYRAAWIVETGELYAAEHLREDGRGGRVEVLARLPEHALERVLDGWPSVCGLPRSYEWLRSRSTRYV
jgi:hypothetical protein